ncbi:MAG: hypothetical protein LBV53_01430 [Mycoplasmataceae bacterium]|jgi:S-adenosylmethionine:tRNA-ribosyltransferase-isomerase (queuine synthetase)|nr:hypothetical protein [Mycoplasmataceae bacterium]
MTKKVKNIHNKRMHDDYVKAHKKREETFKKSHNGKGIGINFHKNRTIESYSNASKKALETYKNKLR